MNRQRALKILVPVLIVVVIIGIWAVKNKPTENLPSSPSETSDPATGLVQPNNDTDFILETSAIELAFTVHQGVLTEEQMWLVLSDMGVEE